MARLKRWDFRRDLKADIKQFCLMSELKSFNMIKVYTQSKEERGAAHQLTFKNSRCIRVQ